MRTLSLNTQERTALSAFFNSQGIQGSVQEVLEIKKLNDALIFTEDEKNLIGYETFVAEDKIYARYSKPENDFEKEFQITDGVEKILIGFFELKDRQKTVSLDDIPMLAIVEKLEDAPKDSKLVSGKVKKDEKQISETLDK